MVSSSDLRPRSDVLPVRCSLGKRLAQVAAASVLLVAILACIIRPDFVATLTLIPAWCWCVPAIGTLVIVMRAGARSFAACLFALWIVFAIGWVEELPAGLRAARVRLMGGSKGIAGPLRVVTLNCAGFERCVEDIAAVRPDIALLQEAPGPEGLARMAKALFGEQGEFLSSGDVAILSRWPLRALSASSKQTFLAASTSPPVHGELAVISLRLSPPPANLEFWQAKFWQAGQQSRSDHRLQLQELKEALAKAPLQDASPLIIGGDFNTTPLDRALDVLRPDFEDCFRQSGTGWGATGTNDWPLFRVDQIWANSHASPLVTRARATKGSDHRLVVSDLRLAKR